MILQAGFVRLSSISAEKPQSDKRWCQHLFFNVSDIKFYQPGTKNKRLVTKFSFWLQYCRWITLKYYILFLKEVIYSKFDLLVMIVVIQ